MRTTAQTISLWIGLGFGLVLFLAFLLFPGFIPPMSPAKTATEVAAFYAGHTAAIRASMVIINLCGIMLVPFFMVVVYQMKRMATPTQVLAYAYLSAVASGATLLAIADLFWLIAAFRPGRDPQLILLLNDMAWIVFTAPVGAFVAQNVCLALAVHLDRAAPADLPALGRSVQSGHRGGGRAGGLCGDHAHAGHSPGTGRCRSGCGWLPTARSSS